MMLKRVKRLLLQFTAKISTSNINEVNGGIIPVEDPSVPKARSEDSIKSDFSPSLIIQIASSSPSTTCHSVPYTN